jgi:4-amino-4-deoxy-L-arabinose transferase-like glycosyltransferase
VSGPRTLRENVRRYWGAIPVAIAIALLVLRALLHTPPLDNLAPAPSNPNDPPGTRAYAGYVMIARGGPVIIGFQTDGPAHLQVGTHRLIAGRGLIKDRIVLPAGPTTIRFAAPPNARLVWNPVGRRGDPEYLPASSLAPTPDGFGPFIGAAVLDGLIALALLLTLVGSLLYLVRARLRAVDSNMWIAMGAVFIGALIVRIIGLSAFGQTWDEDVNWGAGRNYVTNLVSLDLSDGSWMWNFEHPPVMKYLEGIGAQFADGFGPARSLSAIWVSLGCALLVPIGARLYGVRVGVLAGLIAALLPPLVAHGQIVGHEAPTVLWWALAILLALGVHDDPARTRVRLAWVGVVVGVAVASRFANAFVGPLVYAIVVINAPAERRLRVAVEALIIMPLVALATFYVLWPRIWFHPIAMLQASFHKLSQPHALEPFLGELTNRPGRHYFLVYLFATLPVGVLAGVLAYVVRAARELDRAALITLAWFLIPLGVMISPVRQDGVRYVMPCVLALAFAAAAGFEWLASLVERGKRHVLLPFAAVLSLYLLVTLWRIHPYYLDYFGEHVGGPANVEQRKWFETAWWGEGVNRAVDYVNVHAQPNAKIFRNCIEPAHLAWFREDLWTPMTNNPDGADWIVTYAPHKSGCPIPTTMHKVFTVDAQGAPLAEVWTRR